MTMSALEAGNTGNFTLCILGNLFTPGKGQQQWIREGGGSGGTCPQTLPVPRVSRPPPTSQ